MTTTRHLWILASALGLLGGQLRAGDLGDPAPPLQIAKWIKGDPVELEKGKGKQVFVVEFWATWCPPCRASIPHLTEVAKKYRDKGVTIVGVTTETDTEKVSKFVEEWGERMDYVVAQDDGRKTFGGYMTAFEQRGIPHAFIVNKEGQIVWHGHPMAELEDVLGNVVEGKFSLEDARKKEVSLVLRQQHIEAVRGYFQDLQKVQRLGDDVLKSIVNDSALLNELAWAILTNEQIRARDLDLALRAAKAAYDASEGKSPAIVDTYARALFDTGKRKEAIEYQKKAIELCEDGDLRAQLQKTLEEYEKAVRTTVRL